MYCLEAKWCYAYGMSYIDRGRSIFAAGTLAVSLALGSCAPKNPSAVLPPYAPPPIPAGIGKDKASPNLIQIARDASIGAAVNAAENEASEKKQAKAVALVDDDLDYTASGSRLIEAMNPGIVVTVFQNCEGLLPSITLFKAALIDGDMGDDYMTGTQCIKKIRSSEGNGHLIVAANSSSPVANREMMRIGADMATDKDNRLISVFLNSIP